MNPKQEAEKLMNEMLPVAEKMLRQYGEFFPYGGYMKPTDEIVHVGAKDPNTDRPKSKELIGILQDSFRTMVKNEQCNVTAIVFDVVVPIPDSNRKRNAIQVCLDHVDNYSAEVFFPYKLIDNQIIYEDTFSQEGKYEIFKRH
ncbi:MAG TPA: hypothetical protein VHY30_00415 [Verrucomicrobiae bacterium]|jgi:hypothetical protein|nr:hypothetical protein [Verrucomicrobiae bacterium]